MTLALIFDLAQIDTIPVVATSAEDRLGLTLALIFDLAQIDTIPVVATSAEDRLGQPRQRNRSRGILTHPGRPLALREQGLLIQPAFWLRARSGACKLSVI